jgi:hypothetical protein
MFDTPLAPRIVDDTVYLVLNDFGQSRCAYVETDPSRADFDTVIDNLIGGQCSAPARVVAFNTSEGWAKDMSAEVAREIWQRTAGELGSETLRFFVNRHFSFLRNRSLRT